MAESGHGLQGRIDPAADLPRVDVFTSAAPEMESEAPGGGVKIFPRGIDLESTERLQSFERTRAVTRLDALCDDLPDDGPCRNIYSF